MKSLIKVIAGAVVAGSLLFLLQGCDGCGPCGGCPTTSCHTNSCCN